MGVVVRVPATSANLGPGFDALGLALSLYDEVAAEVVPTPGLRVSVVGEGAGELPTDDRHLVVRAIRATFDELAVAPPAGLALTCHNRIPQARGLGSSAAAIVAGVLLAGALAPSNARRLDQAAALELAAKLEGHPDNVAACLLGGITIAWTSDDAADGASRGRAGQARAVRLTPSADIRPTVFVPPEPGLTAAARAALPEQVPHADAAYTAGRAALLVHALTGDPGQLLAATEDRLHQPYRAAAAPGTAELVARLRAAGVAAVVSGAGPSVLALSPVPDGFDPGDGWLRHDLAVDSHGATVREGRLEAYAR